MKFTVFAAATALLCAMVSAGQADEAGEVKGVPLIFEGPMSFRQNVLVKGDPIIHSRSENLATSNIAVSDENNPYIKVKGTGDNGIVGNSLSVDSNESNDSTESGSAWTLPLAIGGCAVAVVGIAGFMVLKKRKQSTEENVDEAKTPANSSPQEELVEYKTDMETPV